VRRDPRVLHMKRFGEENNPRWLHSVGTSEWRQLDKTSPWFVYTLFEADGRLGVPIYVGVTSQLHMRLAQHRRNRAWWPLVGPILAESFPDRDEAYEGEFQRIRALTPLFNIAWNTHTPTLEEG
jgi:hypothetical protein